MCRLRHLTPQRKNCKNIEFELLAFEFLFFLNSKTKEPATIVKDCIALIEIPFELEEVGIISYDDANSLELLLLLYYPQHTSSLFIIAC